MDSNHDPDWLPEPNHPPEPDNIPNAFQIALANRQPDTPLTLARRAMWDPPGVAPSHHQPNDRGRRRERNGNAPRRQNGFSSHNTRNCAECLRHAPVPRNGGGGEKDRSRQLARTGGKGRFEHSTCGAGTINPNFACGHGHDFKNTGERARRNGGATTSLVSPCCCIHAHCKPCHAANGI